MASYVNVIVSLPSAAVDALRQAAAHPPNPAGFASIAAEVMPALMRAVEEQPVPRKMEEEALGDSTSDSVRLAMAESDIDPATKGYNIQIDNTLDLTMHDVFVKSSCTIRKLKEKYREGSIRGAADVVFSLDGVELSNELTILEVGEGNASSISPTDTTLQCGIGQGAIIVDKSILFCRTDSL